MVTGKADSRNRDPQIICETVNQDLSFVTKAPIEDSMTSEPAWLQDAPPPWLDEEDSPLYDEETGELPKSVSVPEPEAVPAIAPATQGAAAVPIPVVEPQVVADPVPNGEATWYGDDTITLTDEFDAAPGAAAERWLMVYYQRSGDDEKDRRRIRKLHGILTSYPGSDRFTIVIEGRKQSLTMEFPNHTTAYCDDLIRDLMTTVGEENIRIFERPA
jgi:hypothetical protein